MEILTFLMGMLWFYSHSQLVLLWLPVVIFLGATRWVIGWFLLAIFVGNFHHWNTQDVGLAHQTYFRNVLITGVIISNPQQTKDKTTFQFRVETLSQKPANALILLHCYQDCPVFFAGDKWQFIATFRKPTNLQNPGVFDYARSLSAKHIHWVGFVKSKSAKRLALAVNFSGRLLALRAMLAAREAKILKDASSLGIIQALSLGFLENISKELWDLFRRTGTTHLMVISGAHIGLSASLGYFILSWIWSRSKYLCLWCPSQKIGGLGGILVAFLYAILTGLGIPAKRALFAATFLMLRFWLSRYFLSWQLFRYALLLVLLVEPHAVLLPGFYLSFGAVAVLMATSQRFSAVYGIRKIFLMQFACVLGLSPLVLYWFSLASMSGLLANIFAIPLVSLVIIPCLLFYLFLLPIVDATWFLEIARFFTDFLLKILWFADKLSFLNLEGYLDSVSMIALLTALVIFIWLPYRFLLAPCSMLVLSAMFPAYPVPPNGEGWVDVLDVGQGLAVLIRTHQHVLLYDTGMAFPSGNDMGRLVVLPYLKTLGVKRLDRIVISHSDLDHRGGLRSILAAYPKAELFVGEPLLYQGEKNCHGVPPWSWDGVDFTFMQVEFSPGKKNNHSCVLKIKAGHHHFLLTGDLEALGEKYLASRYSTSLRSDVLLVGHHGSKTSSTLTFINKVKPRFAIISSGLYNRYHFPHSMIVARFLARGIPLLNTATSGMVSFHLTKQDLEGPFCYAKCRTLKKRKVL